MTTVAYRDGMVAWDSQETLESTDEDGIGSTKYHGIKGAKLEKEDMIVAFMGDSYAAFALFDWVVADDINAPINVRKKERAELLIFRKTGQLELVDTKGRIIILDPSKFYAFGTGAQAALAALHLGCDAKGAVETAALVDPCTGGDVIAHSW